MPDRSLREEELLSRLGWFVKIRWLFLVGLALGILAGHYVFRIEFPVLGSIVVAVVIFFYNLGFYLYHRFLGGRSIPDLGVSRMEAFLQIGLDLLSLTFLIHFSGGIENPFLFFYLFHAILASMLLSRNEVWVVGAAAYGLFLGVVVLEYFGVISHYHLKGLFFNSRIQNLPYIVIVGLVLLITLFTTIYMTTSIVRSLRSREKQLVLAQRMLKNKSEDLEEANVELVEKHKQLVQSEKLASLGQLVSGIAHEINNPIQFIQGNMAILKESTEDIIPILDERAGRDRDLKIARLKYPFFREQVGVLLQDMAAGAVRIRDIVRDLRTFARQDEGRMDDEVDLNDVVRASERLVHNKIKRYRVVKDLGPDLPKLRGSLNRLEQVVVNTLINAADALVDCPEATIRLATRTENEGKEVRLSIADNGQGMTDEVKDRLFDPFFTTKQRTGGTGLGMSITYGIIEEHGGRIDVETRQGAGTTFHYILPVDKALK